MSWFDNVHAWPLNGPLFKWLTSIKLAELCPNQFNRKMFRAINYNFT